MAIISTIDNGAKTLSTSVEFGLSWGFFLEKNIIKEEGKKGVFDNVIGEKASDIIVDWASSLLIVIEVEGSRGYSRTFHYIQRTNIR